MRALSWVLCVTFACIPYLSVMGEECPCDCHVQDKEKVAVYTVQQAHDLYECKCSACHSLKCSECAANLLPSKWRKSVDRMSKMRQSKMSQQEAEVIYDYLVYVSATRKKEKLDQQLSSLAPDQKAEEQDRIAKALQRFQL